VLIIIIIHLHWQRLLLLIHIMGAVVVEQIHLVLLIVYHAVGGSLLVKLVTPVRGALALT
jgi:hypothetical protein